MSGNRLPRLRPRTRRRAVAAALAGIAIVGSTLAWLETSRTVSPRAPAPRRSVQSPTPASSTETAGAGTGRAQVPPLGLYVGPGDVTAAESVAAGLDDRVPYVLDFLGRTTWTTLTDPTWMAQRWHGAPFDLVVGVPMLPDSGGTLAQGASGAFDAQFRLLSQRLVADGLGSVILMLGYQPDDSGTPWYVGTATAAADYVRYWHDIRQSMTAVPGAHFLFEWDAGDAATSPLSPADMYPGDRAADIVATDAFDFVNADPKTAGHWDTVLEERYGPAWMASFAASHHKPMAIAMWGEVPASSGGAGDQPGYVTQLLHWAATERVAMCVLWDYQDVALTGGAFPAADAALRQAVVPASGAKRREGTGGPTRP